MSPAGWRGKNLVLPRSRSLGGCRSKLFLNRLTSSNLTLCSINNISTMNTAMKIIFAIATMLAHVTAPAESYRLLTASAANSSCVGFGLVMVEQERKRCESDRAIPAVPNPENASTAAVISAEILPMDFNGTAEKSIKKNKVRVRDQMFHRISFCFSPILNTVPFRIQRKRNSSIQMKDPFQLHLHTASVSWRLLLQRMAEVGCCVASWSSITSPPPKQEHGLLVPYQIQKMLLLLLSYPPISYPWFSMIQ